MIVLTMSCTLFLLRLCINMFLVYYVCYSSINRRHGTMAMYECDQKDLNCKVAWPKESSDGVQELHLETEGSL